LIYDEISESIAEFGNEITVTPKKDNVSIIRKRQFALSKTNKKNLHQYWFENEG
jgi:hypothetical protein